MKKIELHWQILIAIIIAIAYGLFLAEYVKYISWMGDLFMKSLKMVVAPLILTSIASGVANIGSSGDLGKLGLKTIYYYLLTSILAITTGLLMVNFIQPGTGADLGLVEEVKGLSIATESFGATLINIIPENIFDVSTPACQHRLPTRACAAPAVRPTITYRIAGVLFPPCNHEFRQRREKPPGRLCE